MKKINDDISSKMKFDRKSGMSIVGIAKKYGVSRPTAKKILDDEIPMKKSEMPGTVKKAVIERLEEVSQQIDFLEDDVSKKQTAIRKDINELALLRAEKDEILVWLIRNGLRTDEMESEEVSQK